MSRSSMTSHIHNTHKLPIKEYKEANYPDIGLWFSQAILEKPHISFNNLEYKRSLLGVFYEQITELYLIIISENYNKI